MSTAWESYKKLKLTREVGDYFEWVKTYYTGVHQPTLNNAIELLRIYPFEFLADAQPLADLLEKVRQQFGSGTLIDDVEKQSPFILDVQEFDGCKLNGCITSETPEGKRYSFWQVGEGRLQCRASDCRQVFEVGDEVLPVHGLPRPHGPTNFVCNKCRGLLDKV